MKIDQSKVIEIYRCCANEKARELLNFISRGGAKSYTDLRRHIGEGQKNRGSVVAFYLRKFQKCRVTRFDKETKTYYLTRIGVRVLDLADRFEEFCTEYDMSDVDQDGKVRKFCIVEGRLN